MGTNRRLVEINHNNLLGLGDRASLRSYNTDGSNSLNNLSYTLPLNAKNGKLTFCYCLSDNEIIEAFSNELDINSDYRQYTLTYRQPLVRTPSEEFALGVTADRQTSDSSLFWEAYQGILSAKRHRAIGNVFA